ncbi:MAG TPA: gamma-glutamyltransferase [Beijerinckiaceae bacterium]|nr:gamma-glutamyltransferase [Beijerinckiaceae bacterium]
MRKWFIGLARYAIAVPILSCLAPGCTTSAQQTAPPIPSDYARIFPIVADHGMVVSEEATASAIGVDILRRGGNAIDAAVATGFALAVTLPRAGNLGGGGFMLVHLSHPEKNVAIDYRETAPADTQRDVFLDDKGNFVPAKSQASGLGVGVPGTVAGLALAEQKYGSGKFTLADLIAPAIALARDGFPINGELADSLPKAAKRLALYPASRAIFLHTDGSARGRGDRLDEHDLAATLQAIADKGPDAFYKGDIAGEIAAAVDAAGGHMTLDDLASYRAVERAPVEGTYRGHEIVSMPPPSSGGVHVIEILNILEGFSLASLGQDSAAEIHDLAEAMKLAYADRSKYLGDPDFYPIPIAALMSKAYADQLRATIPADHARPSSDIGPGTLAPYESDQTTHFSVVDADGNAVSNTYTLNFSYGLGLVAAGTGVLLNNELDDFAAKTGVANAFGLTGSDANAPGPRKRPLSSMSPTMVFKDGTLELVTGSPGGSEIINIVVQMIVDVIDFHMNIAEATEAVRVHHQWQPDVLRVESGLSPDTMHLLEGMGYKIRVGQNMGSTETIARKNGHLTGFTDTRRLGTGAVGY